MNANSNIDPSVHQQDIYNKLKSKNFTSPPNYINGLTIKNSKFSQNNIGLLNKLIKIVKIDLICPLDILYKEQYGIFSKTTNEREKCPICLCEFYDDIIDNDTNNINLKELDLYKSHEIDTVKLYRCEDHFYHIECLANLINNQTGFKCAICQKIYGVILGNMPPGKMSANIDNKLKCDGFNENTIVINYNFNSGNINGEKYKGTSRMNYIPNTRKGRILLGLLKIAFDRKLTFTIGTSVTTGEKNCVVWNGIHHKSSLSGGPTNYGYPDPTYFDRVSEELATKGVFKDDYENDELEFLGLNLMYS